MKETHRVLSTMIEKSRVFKSEISCLTRSKFTSLLIHVPVHGEGWTMTQRAHGIFSFLDFSYPAFLFWLIVVHRIKPRGERRMMICRFLLVLVLVLMMKEHAFLFFNINLLYIYVVWYDATREAGVK